MNEPNLPNLNVTRTELKEIRRRVYKAVKPRLQEDHDLKLVKELFLGDRLAIQVFPKKENYVNINPHVLHLWHCVDEFTLPDFSAGTGSI